MAASTRFWRRPEDWRQLLLALLDARQLTLAVVALAVLVRTTLGEEMASGASGSRALAGAAIPPRDMSGD
eukprot:scaffold401_cov399-Prasinococcus_capsulatus_cf.AAC.39